MGHCGTRVVRRVTVVSQRRRQHDGYLKQCRRRPQSRQATGAASVCTRWLATPPVSEGGTDRPNFYRHLQLRPVQRAGDCRPSRSRLGAGRMRMGAPKRNARRARRLTAQTRSMAVASASARPSRGARPTRILASRPDCAEARRPGASAFQRYSGTSLDSAPTDLSAQPFQRRDTPPLRALRPEAARRWRRQNSINETEVGLTAWQ